MGIRRASLGHLQTVLRVRPGRAPAASVETEGATFFAEDAIPELSLARVTPEEIARLFEHYRHPDWPADFD